MSQRIFWDRDRLRVHDESGANPDRDLPLADLLTWLKAGGVMATGSAPTAHASSHASAGADAVTAVAIGAATADHSHVEQYVAKTSQGAMTATAAITDAAAKAAIDAIGAALIAAGLMTAYVEPSSGSSSSE